MSLYDDLDASNPTGNKDAAGWSTGIKLLQTTLMSKKANISTIGPCKKRSNLVPVMDLKRGGDEVHFDQKTGKINRGGIAQFIAPEPSVFAGVKDEYNPMFPNDYDEVVKKKHRERNERDEDRDRDGDRRRRHRESEDEEYNVDDQKKRDLQPRSMQENNVDDYQIDRSKRGVAIAPPPSLLEESSNTLPTDTGRVQNPFGMDEPTTKPFSTHGIGSSVASKIMAKYGYKEGSGLGKKEQGMSSALVVEKTSLRGGKILHERDIQRDSPTPMIPLLKPNSNADLLKNPSKVVVLQNMVSTGEVDAELEGETAEECGKYGKVLKCVIYEIPQVPVDESVRIFVEFEKQESAIKAVIDLNGRFFGGKVVKASFYSLDKFGRLDLADELP